MVTDDDEKPLKLTPQQFDVLVLFAGVGGPSPGSHPASVENQYDASHKN